MRAAATAILLTAWTAAAPAATDADIKRAFAQAQKKGAVAVMQERCGSPTSVYFPGADAASIARTAAALSALAASKKDAEDASECSGGLHEGETRMLELYPDGTVKAK